MLTLKQIDYALAVAKNLHFKKAADAVRIAQIYIQRMDWLLSGDDGEESFLSRLEENLKKIKSPININ